jgi:hypothetical protein
MQSNRCIENDDGKGLVASLAIQAIDAECNSACIARRSLAFEKESVKPMHYPMMSGELRPS